MSSQITEALYRSIQTMCKCFHNKGSLLRGVVDVKLLLENMLLRKNWNCFCRKSIDTLTLHRSTLSCRRRVSMSDYNRRLNWSARQVRTLIWSNIILRTCCYAMEEVWMIVSCCIWKCFWWRNWTTTIALPSAKRLQKWCSWINDCKIKNC